MTSFGYDGDERTFKVSIIELLDALNSNRDKHADTVSQAQKEFRRQAVEHLDKMLKDAREGNVRLTVGLEMPISYLGHYDEAIGILEMTQRAGEDYITITTTEYRQFVQDRWSWTDKFRVSNSSYIR